MVARLFDASPEILQRIALLSIIDTPLGPPREFISLMLVCRATRRILSIPRVYLDVLATKFDIKAPLCRLGQAALAENAKSELCRRFTALKWLRKRNVDDTTLSEVFWLAYLMFEDSDSTQKNVKQLLWANLPTFLDSFIRNRLYEGSETNSGWPLPSELNSLAIALFWLSSSQSSVNRETDAVRAEVLRRMAPFVFAAFRYPIASTAEYCFHVNLDDPPDPTTHSVHGPYPPPPLRPQEVCYFGAVKRKALVPSAPLFASLSYFARIEMMLPIIPPHLYKPTHRSREIASALRIEGPTLEDMQHFIYQCRTRFADFPALDIGALHKHFDPSPTVVLGQPASYRLGSLTGRWQGSYIMPYLEAYASWLNEHHLPTDFPCTGRSPLYVTLEEHFTRDMMSMVPRNDDDKGIINGWLPPECRWTYKSNGIEIRDEQGTFETFYETFRPGKHSNCERRNVVDVIITGKTDERHAAAWGDYHLLGRVRLVDGLMAISRESAMNIGTWILRGYVTSSQNFIGRIKGASNGQKPAGWEGTFSLCKDHTTIQLDDE